MKPLLLAGGKKDPNLAILAKAAQSLGVPLVDARHDIDAVAAFRWDLDTNAVSLSTDGTPIGAGSAFIRMDVFSAMLDSRPAVAHRCHGWFHTVYGWLLADPRVKMLNRDMDVAANSKPAVLLRARNSGFAVPSTLITNLQKDLETRSGAIIKPTGGGDYCYDLAELLPNVNFQNGVASVPSILQDKLIAPEIRIYVVGDDTFAFEMKSSSLDYRVKQDVEVVHIPKVPSEANALMRLMASLKMNFGAADFKTDRSTGHLVLLELNNSPMFARFDEICGGDIGKSIVRTLTAE